MECAALLGSGELDLAVVSDSEADFGRDPQLELDPLMDDPLYVALARSHPLAGPSLALSMSDLRDEIWIEGRGSIVSRALLDAAQRAGFEPRIAIRPPSGWPSRRSAAGVGITLIPTVALDAVRDDIVLRSLGDDAPLRRLSIATHASRYRAPGIEPMKAVLHQVAAEHRFALDALVV